MFCAGIGLETQEGKLKCDDGLEPDSMERGKGEEGII